MIHGEVQQRSVGARGVRVRRPGVACAAPRQRVTWLFGVGQSLSPGHVVHLIEGEGLPRGVSHREVHSLGACYRVEVYTWEWGGLWG